MAGQNTVNTVNNIINTRMTIKKYSNGPKLRNGPFFMQAPSTSSSISIIIKIVSCKTLYFLLSEHLADDTILESLIRKGEK